ncbi:MAG: DUF302 domain-containing protein [Abditibacteriales bacterium]|nr:DUF302 domain-containing protein [Abditibacteriales bacterium]MDW8364638.1 DUF302 domain-containing protein [Abditibacteriales bacterium]
MSSYGITTKVHLPYEQALAKTRDALKAEGFGVITEIDVRQTVKEKLGEEFRPYIILGACNPPLAHKAISTEPEIGLLMPCNVCVWDNGDGTSTVAAVDVSAMFQLVQNPALTDVAETVNGKLRKVVEKVSE